MMEVEHRGQGILYSAGRSRLGHDVPGCLVDSAERRRRTGRPSGYRPESLGKAGQAPGGEILPYLDHPHTDQCML